MAECLVPCISCLNTFFWLKIENFPSVCHLLAFFFSYTFFAFTLDNFYLPFTLCTPIRYRVQKQKK